jgi:glutaredoxin
MPETKRDSVPSATSVIVYALEDCPNCEQLKEYLTKNNIPFAEEDMSSAAALTELRINGVFAREAPVLRKGSVFLVSRQLFALGRVKEDVVDSLIKGE